MASPKLRIPSVVCACSAALVLGLAVPLGAQEQAPSSAEETVRCNQQTPHDFLVRGNWQRRARMPREEIARRRELHQQAIRYRTQHYGFFPGFGSAELNPRSPMQNSAWTRFAGLRVRLNQRVLPALRCAEQEIAASCSATPYRPGRLSGIRDRNTYHNGEISNHVYGIAIDIDPNRNTCCGCVPPWSEHPLCQREVQSIYERMAMPECWVRAFEKYGWYWLGHDQLQDTMHFEFLADPDRIRAD